jgi:hypothetical protein
MSTEKTPPDSIGTMATTRSLRQRGEMVKRCFINMVKCFRVCKSTKPKDNIHETM